MTSCLVLGRAAAALIVMLACFANAYGFDVQGHRGARGLAPENTLAAFRRALEIGVTTIETDIGVTQDGVAVISHNPRLMPELVRDSTGQWLDAPGPALHALTLQDLRRYDIGRLNPASVYARDFPEQKPADGERFPTLDELFQLVRASGKPVRLNVETKITPENAGDTVDVPTFARVIIDAARRAGMLDRVTLQSFDWRTLVEAKRIAPELETSCLTIEADGMNTMKPDASGASAWHAGLRAADYNGSPVALVKAAGCAIWSMFFRNLTPELVADAHRAGLKVLPWTVNNPADMRRLIDMRVDGIITDYPNRLRDVMRERGLPLP